MANETKYLLDADSFIRSKREHYAFDICPGYWDALLRGFGQKRVVSIIPIRKELLRGKDALAGWVKDDVPDGFFEPVDKDRGVVAAYGQVIAHVESHERYSRAAKDKFVRSSDPYLVAFATAKQYALVTYEVSQPESKALVKLPDIARSFRVNCVPPYVMLRQLRIRLLLEPSRRRST